MWQHIPLDLLMHVGEFLYHRDVRCMQATCTDWEKIWTMAGLVSPHPLVLNIEMCDTFYCRNRQYVIDTIEPFIMRGKTSLTLHILQFMMFLPQVKFVWSVADMLHLKTLACLCRQSEKYLVFWCNCTDHDQGEIPRICLTGSDYHDERKLDQTDPDSLYAWTLLMSICVFFLFIPTMIIVISIACFVFVACRTFD